MTSNTSFKGAHGGSSNDLVLDNLEFVRHILRRVVVELPANIDEENLLSAGTVGLIEAARNFDKTRGVAFRTFAYRRVRGAIIDELRRNCPLPQRILENLSLVKAARLELTPPVSIEQLAVATGLSIGEVEECLEASKLTAPQTLDVEDGVRAQRDQYRSSRPELAMEIREVHLQLAKAIEELPEKQRLTLTLYYLENLRLKEIGEVLSRSESRISRILTQAEHSLREAMRGLGLSNAGDLPFEI